MRTRQEKTARSIFIFILILFPLGLMGYQFLIAPNLSEYRIINIKASAPEKGGFAPDTIRIAAGETVHLVIHAPDVMHGFAIGPGLGLQLGDLVPGETLAYDLKIDQPGRHTLYCTIWCSPSHWRMRLTIEVYDPAAPDQLVISDVEAPTITRITEEGLDIDELHPANIVPAQVPSTSNGNRLIKENSTNFPAEYLNIEWLRWQRPDSVAATLMATGHPEKDAWDIVAYLWTSSLTIKEKEKAASLYAQNCAACHGENGSGEGPGAVYIESQNFHGDASPTAFNDYDIMLGGNSAIYYAKLRRGGMGTSMPGFGNLFSPEETWLLADYIWSLTFEK